ncbi:MAG: hypothetical protein AB8B63_25100 [Granulosicoccus sp.]
MNSSRNPHRHLGWLITLLALCCALAACGGGIYGTGSGTDSEISQQPPTSDINTSDSIGVEPDTGENGDTQQTVSAPVTVVNPVQQTAFSNIVPSGLDLPPQLKLINLSEIPISANVFVQDTDTTLFDIPVRPESTSSYSALIPGQSAITVFNTDTLATIGLINPLNVARGSVTTLLIADKLSHSASVPGILPLSTRVKSAAADMAMVRLVTTTDAASTLTTVYTLMPQGTNPGMAEINFAGINTTSQRASDYQLVGAGDYELTADGGSTIAGGLRFSQGVVYTLIITDATDSGVYLEVDRAP